MSRWQKHDEEEMTRLLEETATIQELLEHHDFYLIDTKVEEVGRALGLTDIGLGPRCIRAFRRAENKSPDGKAPAGEAGYSAAR